MTQPSISWTIVPSSPTDSCQALSDLINAVYAVAEEGMWKDVDGRPAARTSPQEVQALLDADRLLLAKREGEIIGSVCVQLLSPTVAEFGMLVGHPDCRGLGLGKALVQAAEDYGRFHNATTMQLELLTPKTWNHPVKEFLHAWYRRIGYQVIQEEPFEERFATLASLLSTDCTFTVYHKRL